ncbi:uncharacterized protein KY384_005606 [Bacidia gigantensis]|uniref:uncharacterized protein n=1 Tax=Bacidia gigantensis TaxID=2732470 RepID=UPI001D04D3A2|nr:uncharacterized protein KY384_005606 [Bacidia gigantensis]KAG8530123.1 hypothetical protein KY384_005606 [Bacidia gigantensis]
MIKHNPFNILRQGCSPPSKTFGRAAFATMSGSAAPANSTEVSYCDKRYNAIREGSVTILTPLSSKPQNVFYNPIQQYNRDLSVLAARVFAEDFIHIKHQREQRKPQEPKGRKRKRGVDIESKDNINGDAPRKEVAGKEEAVQNERSETATVDAGRLAQSPVVCQALDAIPTGPKPKHQLRILDALSATGLRALRYAKELPMATSITANDMSQSAADAIKLNVQYNDVQHIIQTSRSNAVEHLNHASSHSQAPYDIIDLDPYGTAAPFLDAAVRAVTDGGMLCVTCTDAGVFASTGYLEKTFSQYGGIPIQGPHSHEGGLRLILQSIATAAAKYGIAIEPLLSLSIDFYARVFVRVRQSPSDVKHLASKTMIVYSCDAGCGAWSTQHFAQSKEKIDKKGNTIYQFKSALGPPSDPKCEHCGFKTHLAGPMWGGPLHNPHFIQRILGMLPTLDDTQYGTLARLEGMLTIALDEDLGDSIEPTIDSRSSSAGQDSVNIVTSDGGVKDKQVNGIPNNAAVRPIPPMHASSRALHPFFFIPTQLAGVIHCVCPPDLAIRGALRHLGYRVSRSHAKPGSIVTDASWAVIWEIMREWVRQKAPKKNALKAGTAGKGIMSHDRSEVALRKTKDRLRDALRCDDEEQIKEKLQALLFQMDSKSRNEASSDGAVTELTEVHKERVTLDVSKLKIVFDEQLGKQAQGKKLLNYQRNPTVNWGPMVKAKDGP